MFKPKTERIKKIEKPKCNFDVKIGRDMQKDFESDGVQNYISGVCLLASGNSAEY